MRMRGYGFPSVVSRPREMSREVRTWPSLYGKGGTALDLLAIHITLGHMEVAHLAAESLTEGVEDVDPSLGWSVFFLSLEDVECRAL